MIEEQQKEYVKQAIESKYTEGWYLLGKLEWTYPKYGEVTGMPEQDLLWVMSVDKDTYETPEGAKFGEPAVKIGGTHRCYYWCVGNPPWGNMVKSYTPMSVMQILRYLVSSPVVAIGRATEQGTPVMGIPEEVRLEGMTGWVMRPKDTNTDKI